MLKSYRGIVYKQLRRGLWCIYADVNNYIISGYSSTERGAKLFIKQF
jgi:hypothetical protein